jgi:NADH:ubiquinone oxidoreductase subunit 4 (subunit M)
LQRLCSGFLTPYILVLCYLSLQNEKAGIFYVYSVLNSTCLHLLLKLNSFSILFYFCMVFAFLVRIPIFLVHLWLPRAPVISIVQLRSLLEYANGGGFRSTECIT